MSRGVPRCPPVLWRSYSRDIAEQSPVPSALTEARSSSSWPVLCGCFNNGRQSGLCRLGREGHERCCREPLTGRLCTRFDRGCHHRRDRKSPRRVLSGLCRVGSTVVGLVGSSRKEAITRLASKIRASNYQSASAF